MKAITLSEVAVEFQCTDTDKFHRLDITFFNPEKIAAIRKLERGHGEVLPLREVLAERPATGKTPATTEYVRASEGVPIIKVANLSPTFFVEWKPLAFAPKSYYNSSAKGRLKKHDILLLCAAHHSGYIGLNTSIVAEMVYDTALFVGELICLRVSEDEIDPYYLTALLNHEALRAQLRNTVRGVTIHLYPQDIANILILRPAPKIQARIGDKLRNSYIAIKKARSLNADIEMIFQQYFALNVQEDVISFDYTQQSCAEHARLDPRFFDVKYQPLLGLATDAPDRFSTIVDLTVEPIHRGVQPDYSDGVGTIPVLKTVDVQNRKVNWAACRKVTEEFFKDHPRSQLHRGYIVITSTGEGSWGRAAICDIERALADSHLTILKVNTNIVDPYAVLAFLWSEYGRMQFEQRVRGSTGQTEIYPQDIEKIKVLIPSKDDQRLIARKIQEQFALLDEAECLRREAIQDIEELLGGAE